MLIPISLPALLDWLQISSTNPQGENKSMGLLGLRVWGVNVHAPQTLWTTPHEGTPCSRPTPTGKRADILETTPANFPEWWMLHPRLEGRMGKVSHPTYSVTKMSKITCTSISVLPFQMLQIPTKTGEKIMTLINTGKENVEEEREQGSRRYFFLNSGESNIFVGWVSRRTLMN